MNQFLLAASAFSRVLKYCHVENMVSLITSEACFNNEEFIDKAETMKTRLFRQRLHSTLCERNERNLRSGKSITVKGFIKCSTEKVSYW